MSKDPAGILSYVVSIVSNYARNNELKPEQLPALISEVHALLETIQHDGHHHHSHHHDAHAPPVPAVDPDRSVFHDRIVCLEDGHGFKTLKRHLAQAHGMTPAQYREKWGLPADYPITARAYGAEMAHNAVKSGLGKGNKREPAPAKLRVVRSA